MIRRTAVLFFGSIVLLTACATQRAVQTPVSVTVKSETANTRFVSDVRDATLNAIHAQVPDARAMTVAVRLDVVNSTVEVATPDYGSGPGNDRRPINTLFYDSSISYPQPTVPVNNSVDFQRMKVAETDVAVSYTIRDADGRILESKQVRLDPGIGNSNPFGVRHALYTQAADFIASRVKALNH
jgi:hypothetical protein